MINNNTSILFHCRKEQFPLIRICRFKVRKLYLIYFDRGYLQYGLNWIIESQYTGGYRAGERKFERQKHPNHSGNSNQPNHTIGLNYNSCSSVAGSARPIRFFYFSQLYAVSRENRRFSKAGLSVPNHCFSTRHVAVFHRLGCLDQFDLASCQGG